MSPRANQACARTQKCVFLHCCDPTLSDLGRQNKSISTEKDPPQDQPKDMIQCTPSSQKPPCSRAAIALKGCGDTWTRPDVLCLTDKSKYVVGALILLGSVIKTAPIFICRTSRLGRFSCAIDSRIKTGFFPSRLVLSHC